MPDVSNMTEMFRTLVSVLRTLQERCTNVAQTLHKPCTNFTQTLHKLCTKVAQTLHKLCTNFAQQLHSSPSLSNLRLRVDQVVHDPHVLVPVDDRRGCVSLVLLLRF